MELETLFTYLNYSVLAAWAMLALAPRWSGTRILVQSFLYPIILGLIYTGFVVASMFFGQSSPDAGMTSITGVSALFSHPVGALAGWTHYLVFDLFVGAWISRDAVARHVNYFLVIPCLFFTLMFGPFGLLLYFILRITSKRGGFLLDSEIDR